MGTLPQALKYVGGFGICTLGRPQIIGAEIAQIELGAILSNVRAHQTTPI
jgi:hypothetical protein